MNHEERKQMYLDILSQEGFVPELMEYDEIRFKYEGLTCYLAVDKDDEQFFSLSIPGIWSIDSEEERSYVSRACLEASLGTKCAKIYPRDKYVDAVMEQFYSPPDSFRSNFDRCLSALRYGMDQFLDKAREYHAAAQANQ